MAMMPCLGTTFHGKQMAPKPGDDEAIEDDMVHPLVPVADRPTNDDRCNGFHFIVSPYHNLERLFEGCLLTRPSQNVRLETGIQVMIGGANIYQQSHGVPVVVCPGRWCHHHEI